MRRKSFWNIFSVISAGMLLYAGSSGVTSILPNGDLDLKASKELVIEFPDFDCDAGNVEIAIYNKSKGFLTEKPFEVRSVKCTEFSNNKISLNLPAGRFAVAAYHDYNGNAKLDRNFVRYPKEPFGFSNNPTIIAGPPSFESAAFNLSSDMEIRIILK
ncbi:MAG: DUF2141 domain-containing protein [Cryomorphaceae bacterium]|nr:DUF2141 domain-containing protein [Flavobacteriales bacterium]